MRLLGIDFGLKRIGVAVAETEVGVATAHASILASGTLRKDAEAIAGLAAKYETQAIVFGIPVNAQDDKMERICRTVADALRTLGQVVHTVDESMTTVEAERTLHADGLTVRRVKNMKDGEAARILLIRHMESHGAAQI